jgi:peptidoglycan hydrolase-like protein with peptidoglycan-binding domain
VVRDGLASTGLVAAMLSGAAGLAATGDETKLTFRVLIRDAPTTAAVRAALQGAARRLSRPGCARLLGEFSDLAGRPLQENLDKLGYDAPTYLSIVVFADGSVDARCQDPEKLALTKPGSRVVFVCPQFREAQWQKPNRAEAVLIHEALHTLGLGENPPSSGTITERVIARCGRAER